MSGKINIFNIVKGHFDTLKDSRNNRTSKADLVTFLILPLALGFFSAFSGFNLDKDLSALLVNFGSIFTALLLSVLVLVYDQESKLKENKSEPYYDVKKDILSQLYYNISYSIVCAVFLVFLCFVNAVVAGEAFSFKVGEDDFSVKYDIYIIVPVVVYFTASLMLNILMILKRMHALLTSE